MQSNGFTTHRLRDGTTVRCRAVRPSDRGKLLAGFERFSPESRYRRFFSPTPRLTKTMLDRLLDVDGDDRVAIGAERLFAGFFPGPGLGIARFTRLPDRADVAEIAVSVLDEVQGRGLGIVLLRELSAAALTHGIRRFTAWVQPDNEAMKALVLKLDANATSHVEDGLLVFELTVPGTLIVPTDRGSRRGMTVLGGLAERWADGARRILPGRLVDPSQPF
jgi:RimJ/RimL family protein N-acetyltransferase